MVLGHALKSMTTKQAPVCKNLQMVWSDADAAIDLVTTRQIAAQWKAWPEVRLQEYVFPADLKVPHDMVDPNQPNQQIAISEPVLLKLMESELNP
jgi:hypothetical protein